jgi:selenocysteine lyase/cysteine desulfurase
MAGDLKTLDPLFVRAQFPAPLWEWSFFENAGGIYVPRSVIERITAYMTECQVQPGSNFPLAAKAQERMNAGHARMAAMIGAEPDEVIVAIQNHEANSGPWRRLAAGGIKMLDWPVHPETGMLDTAVLSNLLGERTRLVAFPHVSNILGAINDVPAITRMVHAAGAEVCVDGVAFAPHRAVDVKAWDVDYYLFSFYKIFGPHMGCLYGKMEKLVAAANQGHYFFADDDTTHKLNPAGPQHEMIASLQGIDDYFEALAGHHLKSPANDPLSRQRNLFDLVAAHEEKLARRFLDFVNSRDDIRLLGPADASLATRVATFSFTVEGRRSAEIPPLTAKHRVGVSSGHFYAKRLVEALGIVDANDGVVRASMAQYNTLDEVDRLVEALDAALSH